MFKPTYKNRVESRSDLTTLLSEACELEHGLACSYLYAAFSLKQSEDEGGLSWEQLHKVKKWAAQLYLVAAQEMFHLAQAWNILTAIGGTPYYLRPNFPQTSKYYPLNLPLSLEPFSVNALKRFILYELPRQINEKQYLQSEFGFIDEDLYDYKTVGELYQLIADGILKIDEKKLFIGNPNLQIGEEEADFPELIKVSDRQTAVAAIERIMEQGEGASVAFREDSHYGIFTAILQEFEKEQAENGSDFKPVRRVISNPVIHLRGGALHKKTTVITDEKTAMVADLFDDIYALMLRILQFVFSSPGQSPTSRRALSRFAIGIMPMVVKPLGDLLTIMPAGRLYTGQTAGPSFSMFRHVPLPPDERLAHLLIKERYEELCIRSLVLSKVETASERIKSITLNMQRLKDYLP